MRLIIVRHGQTDRNIDDHRPGHHDIPLNENGREQARRVAERLASERFDRIYVSTLRRAQETAAAIAAHHPQVPIIVDQHIHERDNGIFAAQPVAARKAAQAASGESFRAWRPPQGESMNDVKERARQWFDWLKRAETGRSILIVSHGLFLYTFLELAIEDGADVEREDFRLENTGLTILEVPAQGRAEIIHLNNTDHL